MSFIQRRRFDSYCSWVISINYHESFTCVYIITDNDLLCFILSSSFFLTNWACAQHWKLKKKNSYFLQILVFCQNCILDLCSCKKIIIFGEGQGSPFLCVLKGHKPNVKWKIDDQPVPLLVNILNLPDDRRSLQEKFDDIDKNNDGKLSKQGQSIHQSVNQSISQSVNQSIDQLVN